MGSIGWRRTAGAVALVTMAGLVSACGGDSSSDEAADKLSEKIAEQAIEDSGSEDVDVDIDGDDLTFESDEGTVKVGSGELPDSFPEELTVVDGDIVSSVDSPDGLLITVDVDDALAAFDEAVADLEGNDWVRDQLTDTGDTRLAMFSKGDQSALVLGDSTAGQVTYTIGLA